MFLANVIKFRGEEKIDNIDGVISGEWTIKNKEEKEFNEIPEIKNTDPGFDEK